MFKQIVILRGHCVTGVTVGVSPTVDLDGGLKFVVPIFLELFQLVVVLLGEAAQLNALPLLMIPDS